YSTPLHYRYRGTHPPTRRGDLPLMQLRENALGERSADARHAREIVDAGRLHAAQAAEMREQRAAPRCADAADVLQRRGCARLASPRTVALDRKTMRLVADLLQQVQPRIVRRQVQWRIVAGKNNLLETGLALDALGDPD